MTPLIIKSMALAIALAPAAVAQHAVGLLRDGDAIPAAGPGYTVTGISGVAVNGVGGYSAMTWINDGTGLRTAYLGNATGGAPALLQIQKTIGGYVQGGFSQDHSLSNAGVVAYSSGSFHNSALFAGDTLVAYPDQPILGIPGSVWASATNPHITPAGDRVCWRGRYKNAATGALGATGFFCDNLLLAQTGLPIPGMSFTPTGFGNNAFSAQATNHIFMALKLVGLDVHGWVISNGTAIPTSKGYVARLHAIPQENGGRPGDQWKLFDHFGITESGETFWSGTIRSLSSSDEDTYIARDSTVIHREGDVLDGAVLGEDTYSGQMNEQGDIAYLFSIVNGPSTVLGLFLNGKLLIEEGDLVDSNGDGVLDSTLEYFHGFNLAIADDRTIYFTALAKPTQPNQSEFGALFAISDPCGPVRTFGAGCAGTGGEVPQLQLNGCAQAGGNVTLEIHRALGGSTALVFFGQGRASTPISGVCYLNLSGILPSALVLPVDGAGLVTIPATVPSSTPQVSFTMQAFTLDPASSIGAAASNGLEVTIVP